MDFDRFTNPTDRDLRGIRTITFLNNEKIHVTVDDVIHKVDGTPLWLNDDVGNSYPWTSIMSIS